MSSLGLLYALANKGPLVAAPTVNHCKTNACLGRLLSDYPWNWVSVSDKLPPAGLPVWIIREYLNTETREVKKGDGKRYDIERSTRLGGNLFGCDLESTGAVLFWCEITDKSGAL